MPNKLSQFWHELKRRNVVRVITVYAGAAFVIIELINNITEPLSLPDWTPKLVIVLLAIGFPIVFIVSWIYDVHPEGGVAKTEPVEKVKAEDISKSSNGWKVASYISFVVIVGLIVLNIIPRSEKKEVLDKSIAVLPFKSLSDDPDKQYQADGVMDAIVLHLSKIEDLQVKSRTSVEQYRDSKKTIPEICEELGVAYVLEGSFQKSGDQIRLIVQLIKSGVEDHVWANNYDREWKEIFSVQSEVAELVAGEIQSIITPEEKALIEKIPTINLTAYDFYLRAYQMLYNFSYEKRELEYILQILDQAIALDPDFAKAYALKGAALTRMRIYGVPVEIWRDSALTLAEKAIEIDPSEPYGYLLRGDIKYYQFRELDQYKKDLEEAYRLAPGDAEVMNTLAGLYVREGKYWEAATLQLKAGILSYSNKEPNYFLYWGNMFRAAGEYEKAEMLYEQGIRLDPGNFDLKYELGCAYFFDMDEYQNALDLFLEALKIVPNNTKTIALISHSYIELGNLNNAEEYLLKLPAIEHKFADSSQYAPYRHRLGYIKWIKGEKEGAMRLFQEQMKLDRETSMGLRGYGAWMTGSNYYDLAAVNAFLGNREEAYLWLDSAVNKGWFKLWWAEHDQLFDGIRQDEKFQDMVSIERGKVLERRIAYREVLYQPEFMNQIEWFFKED